MSSNGKLQAPSAIDSLEIYLVSDTLNVNVTVTAGPDFLQGEQGSTVKHLNFRPPPCARDGDYNVGIRCIHGQLSGLIKNRYL